MEIIYLDRELVVCLKPAGLLSTDEPGGVPELLRQQLQTEEIRTVHRLDRVVGGLMLLAFKPFKAGDLVEAQGVTGKVIEVNITATKVLTPDNRVVILPNGALSNGVINNYNGRPLRRVEWLVSVSYGVDAAACKEAILTILNSDKRVLKAKTDMKKLYKELNISAYQLSTVNYRMDAIPAPFVALKSLNENDITFVVRAWVRAADYWDVFFGLQERFYTELPPQGFTFAYPHVDVTMLKD